MTIPCRTEAMQALIRERRWSPWDYHTDADNGTDSISVRRAEQRRNAAAAMCADCPVKARCLDLRARFTRADGHPPSGIWGGVIFPEKTSVAGVSELLDAHVLRVRAQAEEAA